MPSSRARWGSSALALILFEGGLADLVAAAARGGGARGAAQHGRRRREHAAHRPSPRDALFDLSWLEALLLGAVVASTDAAAVFSTLRFTHIRRRLARTLEAESGGNDPMAIALTLGLIAWIEQPGQLRLRRSRPSRRPPDRARARRRCRARRGGDVGIRASPGLDRRVRARRLASPQRRSSFGVADAIGGSGFLAVYLVGLAVGSTPSRYRRQLVAFHEGLAFLAQVALFVVLGLLVFPHELPAVALAGLALALFSCS